MIWARAGAGIRFNEHMEGDGEGRISSDVLADARARKRERRTDFTAPLGSQHSRGLPDPPWLHSPRAGGGNNPLGQQSNISRHKSCGIRLAWPEGRRCRSPHS
jgi:hypothetical protein